MRDGLHYRGNQNIARTDGARISRRFSSHIFPAESNLLSLIPPGRALLHEGSEPLGGFAGLPFRRLAIDQAIESRLVDGHSRQVERHRFGLGNGKRPVLEEGGNDPCAGRLEFRERHHIVDKADALGLQPQSPSFGEGRTGSEDLLSRRARQSDHSSGQIQTLRSQFSAAAESSPPAPSDRAA
jgi:hypothetical protein